MKKEPTEKITASQIVDLLAIKHAEDVFVPECKDGPTQGSTHFRMDAWAMKKSWTNPLTLGYEVKVSRSDFLGDDKWHAYLQYCNEFSFVCPTDLIKPEELPTEVGLYWATPKGTRLYIKKKAVRREVQIPEDLYRYILMCRAKVARHWYEVEGNGEGRKSAMAMLAELQADKELGYTLGRKISEGVDKRVKAIEEENQELKSKADRVDKIGAIIEAAGFKLGSTWEAENLAQKYKETLAGKFPPELERAARSVRDDLEKLLKLAGKYQEPHVLEGA